MANERPSPSRSRMCPVAGDGRNWMNGWLPLGRHDRRWQSMKQSRSPQDGSVRKRLLGAAKWSFRYLILVFDGTIFPLELKEPRWARFFLAEQRHLRQSVAQFRIVKRDRDRFLHVTVSIRSPSGWSRSRSAAVGPQRSCRRPTQRADQSCGPFQRDIGVRVPRDDGQPFHENRGQV